MSDLPNVLSLDVETNAKDPRWDMDFSVLGVSYSSETDDAYIPIAHRSMCVRETDMALCELRCLVESFSHFVFHNAKFDLTCLARIGISLWNSDWYDTLLMQHMVDENIPSKELDYLGKHYFNEGKEKDQQFTNFVSTFGWSFLPIWMVEGYAIQDAKLTRRLFYRLYPEMVRQGFV